jgi:hypothetical protein
MAAIAVPARKHARREILGTRHSLEAIETIKIS